MARPRTSRPRRLRMPMKRRKPRRHVSGLGRKSVYSYKIALLPQYVVHDTTTAAGVLILVTDQTNPAPLNVGTGSHSNTQGTPDAAGCGVANYYSYGQAVAIRLDDLQQYVALSSQYDYFRINSVTCTVTYKANATAVGGLNPTIYAYIDQDDKVIPTSQASVIGKQGVKKWEFNDMSKTSYSITFKPKFKNVTGLVGGTVATTKPTTGWLDCAIPQVEHFGLKLWTENLYLPGAEAGAPPSVFQFDWKYNISFKSPINIY